MPRVVILGSERRFSFLEFILSLAHTISPFIYENAAHTVPSYKYILFLAPEEKRANTLPFFVTAKTLNI